MEPDRLEVFRKLLQDRLDALSRSAGQAIGTLVDQRESLTDAADIASEESDRDFTLRMHDHERVLVEQIRGALRRVELGDYGECVACGEEIGERRLMARPMATHCIDCQTEIEAQEASAARSNTSPSMSSTVNHN